MLVLRVYIIPDGAKSQCAIDEALQLQNEQPDHLVVEVIDAAQHPEAARREGVCTLPAAVLTSQLSGVSLQVLPAPRWSVAALIADEAEALRPTQVA